jgi:hypothetical protein
MEERMKSIECQMKELTDSFSNQVKSMELIVMARAGSYFEKMLVDNTQKSLGLYEEKMQEMHSIYDGTLNQVKSILQSLPIPQVNVTSSQVNVSVPENAIQIQQSTPNVNVSVPENSIRIEQSTPNVNVNVPESAIKMEPSIVNMTMPENAIKVDVRQEPSVVNMAIPKEAFKFDLNQAIPNVNVNVPKAKPIKKHISYDELGRPDCIIQTEEE